MDIRRIGDVELLVVDPDQNVRDSLRHVLHDNGFRQLRSGSSWNDIRATLVEGTPDLLISDSMLPDGDLCELIYRLRHHTIGSNPFLPIIALTWEPTPDLVKRVINSGADTLLTKPISASQLVSRIQALIDSRKPFIVTSDYIGPDRRKNDDRPSDIPHFDVPNVLREKVKGLEATNNVQARIDEAFDTINLEKLDRYAVQIGWLVERIVPALGKGEAPDDGIKVHLERLVAVAEDTGHRMIGTRHEHISDLCQSLIVVARNIVGQGDKPLPRDVQLLVPLSNAVRAGFRGDRKTVDAARKIWEEISQ